MARMGCHGIEGTCMVMCTDSEIAMRERNGLLHRFEVLSTGKKGERQRADRDKVVKEYQRPAAGKSDPVACELRPPAVLHTTVCYLIDHVVTKTDCPWNVVYDYVFDRLRAVRQDLVIQRVAGQKAITILLKIVRFHIYANYRLCSEPISRFDSKINETHIQECLKRLLVLHSDGQYSREQEASVYSLYLLYNIGNCEAITQALHRKQYLGRNHTFGLAFEISRAWWCGNYARVFRLARQLSPIALCAFHHQLPTVYRKVLGVFGAAYSNKLLGYAPNDLAHILTFDDLNGAIKLCSEAGFSIDTKGIHFKRIIPADSKIEHGHLGFIDHHLPRTAHDLAGLIHGYPPL